MALATCPARPQLSSAAAGAPYTAPADPNRSTNLWAPRMPSPSTRVKPSQYVTFSFSSPKVFSAFLATRELHRRSVRASAGFVSASETGGPLHAKRRPPLQSGASWHRRRPLDSATLRRRFAFCGLLHVRATAPPVTSLIIRWQKTRSEHKKKIQEQ